MKKVYSILRGTQYDFEVTKVVCEEKDIRMIANAIFQGTSLDYNRPIACVVAEGDEVDFNNFDILIADCM